MIKNIHLICFRNHLNFKAELDSELVVISGENGAGKTNILEAISLFAPGRSFRNCKFDEIINNQEVSCNEWGVHITFRDMKFSTGYFPNFLRKIKKNGEHLKSQSDILKDIKVLWLLPQMENIFLGPASSRRKFFDSICYNLFPEHAKNILRYEYYLKSRLKLLQTECIDTDWLNSVESNLAKFTILIQESRKSTLDILKEQIKNISSKFLRPDIELVNLIEPLENEFILRSFNQCRILDKKSGRSNFGAHKTDLLVIDHNKGQKAELCSTGEQKALLISFFLTQALAIKTINGIAPIMLMDEILAYFDPLKQAEVINELRNLSTQIWITTTKSKEDFFKFLDNNRCSWLGL
ncbi:MAG: AAA family ATPase [Candidatus Midichloria sp.]|nr:MAG: AAA family ATPase [Candidatus Midichloria sp.]